MSVDYIAFLVTKIFSKFQGNEKFSECLHVKNLITLFRFQRSTKKIVKRYELNDAVKLVMSFS